MGYELRREIRDLLPRGGVLTDKECRLILELADNANDTTRQAWPGVAWLAEVCDIPNPKRVGEFLTSIARKWVELRVEIGKDRHGKPYFAKPGHKTVYRFPTRAELVALLGADKVPATGGLYMGKVPAKGGAKVPPLGGPKVPAKGGPFSSGSPQRISSPPPPTPSNDLAVVEAELVEEGEDSKPSEKAQLQGLIDETRLLRPNWSPVDMRVQISAALPLLGGSFEAVAELVRRTASDPTSAKPSRITASGNPHLRAAATALMIAKADACPDVESPIPLHPQAHAFTPKPESPKECQRCPVPEGNQIHRVPRPRNDRQEPYRGPVGGYAPFRNPPIEAYYGEL